MNSLSETFTDTVKPGSVTGTKKSVLECAVGDSFCEGSQSSTACGGDPSSNFSGDQAEDACISYRGRACKMFVSMLAS